MKSSFKRVAQRGFTLIELIITIVIIGVLAAVAIPKFLDLSNDAEKGVAAGVGAALASGTSVNYGRYKVPGYIVCTALNTPAACVPPITSCTALDTYKTQLADIPALYVVSGGALLPNGVAGSCTLTAPSGSTVTFNAYGSV
jgi:MSHA pilin protein MshA